MGLLAAVFRGTPIDAGGDDPRPDRDLDAGVLARRGGEPRQRRAASTTRSSSRGCRRSATSRSRRRRGGWFKALLLPWLTLSILYIGIYARVLRSALVEAQEEDYVRTARAKGLTGAARPAPPRAPHVADRVRQPLRARLRRARRRRRAPHRGGLRAARDRLAHLRLAPELRPAGDHGDGDVRGVLRRRRERGRRPLLRRGSTRGCAVPESAAAPLLEVREPRVSFRTENGVVQAVDGLSLTLALGEVLGIVGESGSGKTVSMMAVMRLIRDPNAIDRGRGAPPRARPAEALARRDARDPRRRDRDDLPGSDDRADARLHASAGRSPSSSARTRS